MPFYQSGLNSGAPYTGTKLSDTALDTHKTYHLSDGRLYHTEHNYANGVVEIVGTKLRIHPSSWIITVQRDAPVDSIKAFQVLVQVGYGAPIGVSGASGTGGSSGFVQILGI